MQAVQLGNDCLLILVVTRDFEAHGLPASLTIELSFQPESCFPITPSASWPPKLGIPLGVVKISFMLSESYLNSIYLHGSTQKDTARIKDHFAQIKTLET